MAANYTQWVNAFFAEGGWGITPDFDGSGVVDFTIDHYLAFRWQPTAQGRAMLSAEALSTESGDELTADSLTNALRFAWDRLPDSPYQIGFDSNRDAFILFQIIQLNQCDAKKALEVFEDFRQEVDLWIAHLNDLGSSISASAPGMPSFPGGFLRP